MRKLKQLTLALLLAMLVVTGCKKDENQNLATESDAQAGTKTTKQLLAFRDNLKLKSVGSLPIDSATWYLEGLLNYEKANNNHQFDGLEFFHDTLVMYTAGSSLSLGELSEAYNYFTDKLNLIAQTQNISNFAFDAVDISIITNSLKSGETKITMLVGGGLNTVGIYIAFGETDYWAWGIQGGKCGAYAGQGGLSDAAQQLNYRFTHPWAGTSGYYTGLFYVTANGEEFPDPNNPGPYCDYKIFYFDAGNTGIWPCLGPEELNYYLAKMPEIIASKKPAGKSFAFANAYSMFFPNGQSVYYHEYHLWYGDFTINNPNN